MIAAMSPVMPHKPGLLIVDDDPLIVDTLSFVLATDFDVHAAASRETCIAQLRDMPQPPPLALIDLGLPPFPHRPDEGFALNGDQLALSPDMKIIVLSAYLDEEKFKKMKEYGADACFSKPFPLSQLKEEIARMFHLR